MTSQEGMSPYHAIPVQDAIAEGLSHPIFPYIQTLKMLNLRESQQNYPFANLHLSLLRICDKGCPNNPEVCARQRQVQKKAIEPMVLKRHSPNWKMPLRGRPESAENEWKCKECSGKHRNNQRHD